MTNHLNVAEWIIVGILSVTLFILLILAIILTVKLIKLSAQVKKVVETGQSIADKAEDVVDNVRDVTATGSIAKSFLLEWLANKFTSKKKSNKKNKE